VELSKPAVYKLMNSLIAGGMAIRESTGGYRLGWGTYELSSTVAEAHQLATAARFMLMDLADIVPGAALLSVANQDRVLYVDREQGNPTFQTTATIGHRAPLHATASGKVLLAGYADRELAAALTHPLAASTTTTITQPSQLWAELRKVRQDGFASCWGEHEPSLASLAVPVFSPSGGLVAALAVAIPTSVLRKSSPARFVTRLQQASASVTQRLE
jgi:DNA-binding IclR family transcriptional regulator